MVELDKFYEQMAELDKLRERVIETRQFNWLMVK